MMATISGQAVRKASFMPATSGGRSWPSLNGSGAHMAVEMMAPAAPHQAAGRHSTAASSTETVVRLMATATAAPTRPTTARHHGGHGGVAQEQLALVDGQRVGAVGLVDLLRQRLDGVEPGEVGARGRPTMISGVVPW